MPNSFNLFKYTLVLHLIMRAVMLIVIEFKDLALIPTLMSCYNYLLIAFVKHSIMWEN